MGRMIRGRAVNLGGGGQGREGSVEEMNRNKETWTGIFDMYG